MYKEKYGMSIDFFNFLYCGSRLLLGGRGSGQQCGQSRNLCIGVGLYRNENYKNVSLPSPA
jgi:hypothetical protein